MNRPYFSIVIPTYNRASLLTVTLNTVLNQTFNDYEVIIIDNGSTDDTKNRIEPFCTDCRIKYFKYPVNKERSWARNKGIAKSSGLFLTFLDSDDFIYPCALEDAYLFSIKNPEIKFFHNMYELVDSLQNPKYQYSFPSLTNQHKAISSGNFLSCIGVYLHSEIYQNLRFDDDPKMIAAEDYEAWIRVLAKYQLGRINKINNGIRDHEGRSVNQNIYTNLDYQRQKLTLLIKNDPVMNIQYSPYLGRLSSSFLFMKSVFLAQQHKRLEAWIVFIKAVSSDFSVLFTKRAYQTLFNIIKAHSSLS